MANDRITIFDTTLRDGEQSPGCSMFLEEKIELAKQLEVLGVDIIEAGFPIASEGDFEAVKAVAAACTQPKIAALARTVEADVIKAGEALKAAKHSRIHTFIATSDIHLEFKLKKTRDEVLRMIKDGVSRAHGLADEVEFSAEDATRSDPDFLHEALETAIEAGASTLNIPDTVGYSMPDEFAAFITNINNTVIRGRDIVISVHCHNDLGLAVANTLAAIEAGARQVECTINGIGERAGNAALEEVVMATAVRSDRLRVINNIDTTQLYPTSQLLSSLISFGVQPNKAIVGRNAFAHEAGIHQHGMLSNPLCYEIMTPESVGAPKSGIVLGKHSGRHALVSKYESLGVKLEDGQVRSVYERFTALADRKKNIYDQDLLGLMTEVGEAAVAV